MVPEAPLEQTEHGLVPQGDGWFVLNARDARWRAAEGRGAYGVFEGETEFSQLGIHLVSLGPRVAHLRAAVQRHAGLRELAASPLLLLLKKPPPKSD